MTAPEFTFERGVATMTWNGGHAVRMTFELFRNDRRTGDASAELSVHHLNGGPPDLLHRARLNLLSTRTRSEVARVLEDRSSGLDWPLMLEQASYRALEAHRRGEPAILLRDAPLPEHDGYILEPFAMHGDPVITFGDSGAVKSYLALAAGASIHSGKPVLGMLQPDAIRRVGIFDFEWKPAKHLKRLRALVGPGLLPDLVYVPCMSAGPLSQQVERLRRIINQHRIEYGIFDSVGLACAGPPEDAAVALDFFQALAYLELQGSWLLAHVNRSGDTDRPFGSTFWQASARSTWYAKKARENGDRIDLHLFHRKINDGPKREPVGLQFQFRSNGRVAIIEIPVTEADAAGAGREPTAVDRIVEALKVRQPQDYYELADALGLSSVTIREKANSNGRLFTISDGPKGSRKKLVRLKEKT